MASMNQLNTTALAEAVKKQVFDALENTLDIVITKAVREGLKTLLPQAPAANADVHMPEGEKCAAIWHELDRLSAAGKPTNLALIRKIGAREGWNENTTRIQFYRWRSAQKTS